MTVPVLRFIRYRMVARKRRLIRIQLLMTLVASYLFVSVAFMALTAVHQQPMQLPA